MDKRIFSRPGEIVAYLKEKFKPSGQPSHLGKAVQIGSMPTVPAMQPAARRSRFSDN